MLFRLGRGVVAPTAGFALTLAFASVTAAEWPAYRGPNGDGISRENLKLREWPADGLKQIWKAPTATGFSSFSVAGGKVFTLVRRAYDGTDRETCVALNAQTGRELWAVPLGLAKYDGGGDSGGGGDGPRCTPTVHAGKVYVFDAHLLLACLEAGTGKEIWRKDLVTEHAGTVISWQSAASPLLDDGLVFVAGGGDGQALLGLNPDTGAVVWKGQSDKATHAMPVAATIAGTRQIIFFMRSGLVAVAPKTGAVLWRYSFPFTTSTASSPVVAGDLVYCSAGYQVGAGLVRISRQGAGFEAKEVWRRPKELQNHWSTPVFKDGCLYGMFSFKEFGTGPLKCVELLTGKEMWSQPGFGPGNVILVDDRLVVLGDKGQLVLLDPTPGGYKEISRMQAATGKCWTTPAYSDGRLYVRSTKEGVCLDARGK